MCDNIQQHSQFTHGTLLAQYFPNMEYVDIGVLDNGITIPGSYERYQIEVVSDANAIEQAIQGVSTKLEKGRGHGLPSSFAIGTQELGGEVYILSRTGALVHRSGATNLYKLENGGLLGMVVYFRFRLPKRKPDITPYLS